MLDYPVYNLFGDNDNFGGGYAICRSGGWFKMTDSEISLHNDDSLNFHDSTTIARAEGLRTVRVVNNGGTASLAAEPGM